MNGERLVLLGWSRAILLQLAHPLVAAGIDEHSTFRRGGLTAVTRLHHTIKAMLALTFGDDERRRRSLAGIRAIHARINGRLQMAVGTFPAGTPYSAEDPALVLWVHATLLESIPLTYGMLRTPLTPHELDAYCDEAAAIAVELGAREAEVPRTWTATQRYLHDMYASGTIAVGDTARELAAAVLRPPFAPLVAPLDVMNRTLTIGLLPRCVRDQYGFPWTAANERHFQLICRAAKTLRHLTPDRLGRWPQAL